MRIERIVISRHRLALEPPFHAAWDSRPREHFDTVLVRVQADGLAGIGAGDEMDGFARYAGLFLGCDPLDLERHYRVLDNLQFHAARYWPLDVALWDLAGKVRGEPVWRLLGGTSGRLPLYASTGTLRDAGATAEAVEALAGRGFSAVKLRFHRADWRDDVAVVEAVRARVGDRLALLVDANQGWRMPWDIADPWPYETALQVARALAELGVWWLEEPLHRGDRAGMARLRGEAGLRIAAAEMTRERHELEALIDEGCVDVLQPDCVVTQGIGGLRQVAARAASAGVIFSPHTWGNGIGLLANAHLAAAFGPPPWLEFPFDPPQWTAERRDFILAEPILPAPDGSLDLTEAPGFGIRLEENRLAATLVEEAVLE